MGKSVAFHNLGCKVNSYETEKMMKELAEKGYDIINPIYDSIRCEKIFKGHAYFIVTKNGKKGIVGIGGRCCVGRL